MSDRMSGGSEEDDSVGELEEDGRIVVIELGRCPRDPKLVRLPTRRRKRGGP